MSDTAGPMPSALCTGGSVIGPAPRGSFCVPTRKSCLAWSSNRDPKRPSTMIGIYDGLHMSDDTTMAKRLETIVHVVSLNSHTRRLSEDKKSSFVASLGGSQQTLECVDVTCKTRPRCPSSVTRHSCGSSRDACMHARVWALVDQGCSVWRKVQVAARSARTACD
jgi:hypothetical protein